MGRNTDTSDIDESLSSEETLYPLQSHPIPSSHQPPANTKLPSVSMDLPVLNILTKKVSFCVWLLSPIIMLSMFSSPLLYFSTPEFLFFFFLNNLYLFIHIFHLVMYHSVFSFNSSDVVSYRFFEHVYQS